MSGAARKLYIWELHGDRPRGDGMWVSLDMDKQQQRAKAGGIDVPWHVLGDNLGVAKWSRCSVKQMVLP